MVLFVANVVQDMTMCKDYVELDAFNIMFKEYVYLVDLDISLILTMNVLLK